MTPILSERNRAVLEKKSGKILVGYLLAAYPDAESFLSTVHCCAAAGLDIFEIGFPSADPYFDGEIIQRAHRAVRPSIATDLSYWKRIRESIDQPIWIMGYQKDLEKDFFYRQLAENDLVDNFVIPDMDEENRRRLSVELESFRVDVMSFVNAAMTDVEIDQRFQGNNLIYHQLYSGPTGMSVKEDNYERIIALTKRFESVRIFAGFGIDTPKRVRKLLENGFDGAVIGTAMVKKLNESPDALCQFIRSIKAEINTMQK